MPIRQLPEDLINRIAAGEVVERPASVVKELVENAIDAGARRITVTTAAGGKALIRVEDDGCGMDERDLALSIERHATSKLPSDGLENISTLGFRGEALASIGSVSDLTIASRRSGDGNGQQICVRYGAKEGLKPHPMNCGTVVEVKNLFARVPARLKFLKSDRAETVSITDVVRRLALANPSVHFVLKGSDREVQNWPAVTGNGLAERVSQVIGPDFADNAVCLAGSRHGVVVGGMAGLPTFSRANSLHQFYFVNGRAVRDKVLLGAVRAAYADFLFRDRFPVIALFVSVDPLELDVNVHPAKAELRFRDVGAVRSAVLHAVSESLAAAGYRASSSLGAAVMEAFRAPAMAEADIDQTGPIEWPDTFGQNAEPGLRTESPAPAQSYDLGGLAEPSARFEPAAESAGDHPLGVARVQMFENYIIAQTEEGLLLVDQHAAHERLVYERFKVQLAAGPVARQAQLIPVVVDMAEEDCRRMEEATEVLERLGLMVERFGPRAIAVRETPALLGRADVPALVRDLADGLAEWDSTAALSDRLEAVIGRIACHGSVRSGRRLRVEEMNALLREMEATPHSGQCIHGRPTYVELKTRDIEKLFGRR